MAPTYQTAGGTNSAVQDDPRKKKAPNIPYIDPRNPTAILPVTNQAVIGNPQNNQQPPVQQVQPMQPQQPQNQNTQLRNQAMETLLTKATQSQQPSPVQGLVNQQTTNLLQDPNMGWNPEQYKQAQLSNYDKNEAQLFEALRQQFADSADTGIFRNDALQNQLNTLANRRTLESDIDYENRDYGRKSVLDALAEGRATEAQNQQISNTPIDNLVKALQAGEGEAQRATAVEEAEKDRTHDVLIKNMSIEAQESITRLKGMIDEGLMVKEQDWKSTEAQLEREQARLLQQGDISGALQIEKFKGEIQAAYQKRQQQYENTQRELSQVYNTSERLDIQKYEANMKYLDAKLLDLRAQGDAEIAKQLKQIDAEIAEAASKNDFRRVFSLENFKAYKAEEYAASRAVETRLLEDQKFAYDWRMQNNALTHEATMVKLNADIKEAQAARDNVRTENLVKLQAGIEMEQMTKQHGFDTAITQLKGRIDAASAAKDFEYATALKSQELTAVAQENAKDRALEQAELALRQDAAAYQRYEVMSQTDPEGAANYLKSELAKKGIAYNPIDAFEQAKKAIQTDFELAKEQYKMSHNGSLEGFDKFYNETMFGETSQEDYVNQIVTGQLTFQQLKADPEKKKVAIDTAISWNTSSYKDKKGKNMWKFNSLPDMNVPFNDGSGVYMRISDPVRRIKGGADWQTFQAIDVNTGKTRTFIANGR